MTHVDKLCLFSCLFYYWISETAPPPPKKKNYGACTSEWIIREVLTYLSLIMMIGWFLVLFPSKSVDHSMSYGGPSTINEINYGFVYIAHPRAVTNLSWRKTSKYMPKWVLYHTCMIRCIFTVNLELIYFSTVLYGILTGLYMVKLLIDNLLHQSDISMILLLLWAFTVG
jgi:hypothetical protein